MTVRIFGGLMILALAIPGVGNASPNGNDDGPGDTKTKEVAEETRAELSLLPESRLWFEGGSTVRGYSCEAETIESTITTRDGTAIDGVASLRDVVESVGLTFPVAELECGNGTMNGHMRDALKAEEFPKIEFYVDLYELEVGDDGKGQITMFGDLTIIGETMPITIEAEAEEQDDGTVTVRGSRELDMTMFGVKPPRLMLGTLRVHDDIEIHYEMVLGR